jgi:hypothetical protein
VVLVLLQDLEHAGGRAVAGLAGGAGGGRDADAIAIDMHQLVRDRHDDDDGSALRALRKPVELAILQVIGELVHPLRHALALGQKKGRRGDQHLASGDKCFHEFHAYPSLERRWGSNEQNERFLSGKKQFLIVKCLQFLADRGPLRGASRATGRDGARLDALITAPPTGPQTAIQSADGTHLNMAPRGVSALAVTA